MNAQYTRRRAALAPLLLLGLGCNPPDLPAAGSANDASIRDSAQTAADAAGDAALDGATVDGGALATCAKGCHGSESSPAPPLGLGGESATSATGVGAHTAHLGSSNWHAELPCSSCHLVPAEVGSAGHMDTSPPAELTWSALAKTGGATPSWDGTRCSGTYCHGATLSGGSQVSPLWTEVDGTQAACGSCHGLPPAAGHPTSSACHTCHGAVVDASMAIIAPALHIDGKLQASGGSQHPTGYTDGSAHGADFNTQGPAACSSCHGADLSGGSGPGCGSCHSGWKTDCTFCHGGLDNQTGAPPESVSGATATSSPAVGRHSTHVGESASHSAYGCDLCHTVPADALSPGHVDPGPAEVVLGGLGAGGSYSHGSATCSNIYCHGNGRPGSSGTALWTGSLSGCTACHGSPSSMSGRHGKHVTDKKLGCNACHACVVDSQKTITDKTAHIDGTVDVCGFSGWIAATKTCSSNACHSKTFKWGGGN